MAWTANLDSIRKDGGNVIAAVTYTSDKGDKETQDIRGNDLIPDKLAEFVAARVQILEVRDLAAQTLTLGPISLPAKTPEQQAQLDSLAAAVAQKP